MSDPRFAMVATAGAVVGERPTTARPRWPRVSSKAWLSALLAASGVAVGMFVWLDGPTANPAIASSRAVSADALEQQYGAKIDMVGMLAAGGLIELRFQVVDKDKALALFGSVEDMPMLAVEGTSSVLQSAKGMKHHLTLLDGGSYFIFYTNVGNAVREGSTVSMVINGVRLEHIVVQE
jgi:hypothetical protein